MSWSSLGSALPVLAADSAFDAMANRKRLIFSLCSFCFLALAVLVAFGQAEVGDGHLSELGIIFCVALVMAFLIGRPYGREDERAGIVSYDDDDDDD